MASVDQIEVTEGEQSINIDFHPNPLFTEVILRKIFSFLDLPSLLQCRLVCKSFHQHPSILKRLFSILITLDSYSKLDSFLNFLNSSNSLIFRNFDLSFKSQFHSQHFSQKQRRRQRQLHFRPMDSFDFDFDPKLNNLFNHPFVNLIKLKLTMDSTHLDSLGLLRLLLSPGCRELDTLHIYNLSYNSVYSQGFKLNDFDPNLSLNNLNLKRLIIEEVRRPIVNFLKDFLNIFNKIEEIVLKCDNRSDWDNQSGIWKEHSPLASSVLQALSNLGTLKGPLRLKKLKILRCGILDKSHFKLLTQMGEGEGHLLRLRELELYSPAKDVDSEDLKSFLETQNSSLEILRVLGNAEKLRRSVGLLNGEEFRLDLSYKMELRVLQLSGRDKDTPVLLKGPLDCSKNRLPYLTKLIVKGFATNILEKMEDYFPLGGSPCMSLRALVLPAEIKGPFPLRIKGLFPNLTELEVKYPDSMFLEEVFSSLGKLEKLKVTLESDLCVEQAILGRGQVNEGIGQLKRLQTVEVIVETEHNQVPNALSDLVTFALGEMKWLKRLTLLSCCWYDGPVPCNFIGPKCQQELREMLEDTIIIFNPVSTSCPHYES